MDKWHEGIESEITFWDGWLEHAGYGSAEFPFRIDPDAELQPEIARLLDGGTDRRKSAPSILDVGAGPLTFLGKKYNGKLFTLVAVDALAYEFSKLLEKHNIIPPVKTIRMDSEQLYLLPRSYGRFDLITARNTLDHSYNPMQAILTMPRKLKAGGIIYMFHKFNEGLYSGWTGLHQWNFYLLAGCLMLSSQTEIRNVTAEFSDQYPGCTIENKEDNGMIITIIRMP